MIKRLGLYTGILLFGVFLVSLHHRSVGVEIEGGYSQAVYSSTGELLRLTLSKDEKYRQKVQLEDVPKEVLNAFLQKEDKYFYYHPGVNFYSLARAAYLSYFLKAGKYGASTITMQLVRLHRKLSTRSIVGKLKQITWSFVYEVLYSKDQILEAYLNLVPFGRNIEGIRAASTIYLKKELSSLNDLEAMLLAVIPQRPQLLNHHFAHRAIPQIYLDERIRLERQIPVEKELKHFLTMPVEFYSIEDLPFIAPHLTTRLLLGRKSGDIRSTLNLDLQELLNQKIKNFTQRMSLFKVKNASALLINTKTMELLASVGSADFFDSGIFGQVDGTISKRSPGSTLKPFLYGLGFEQGLIIPKSIVYDAPANFNSPSNFDLEFLGPITVEEALFKSRNIPATDILRQLKKPQFYSFLKQLGIQGMKSKDHYGSSLVLGSLDFTMSELAELYAMLANNGLFRKIRSERDQELSKGIPVMTPEASVMVKSIIEKTIRPDDISHRKFLKKDKTVFWKTGTSFGHRDAWTIGIMDQFVLAVWVGDFESTSNPLFVGIKTAAPLFFEILDGVSLLRKPEWGMNNMFASNLNEVDVCSVSGKIPTKFCQKKAKSLFIPGISPIHKCDVHRPVLVSKVSGLRSCNKLKEPTEEVVFEHWPSQINLMLRSKGIAKKLPPKYAPACGLQDQMTAGRDPVILSPKNGTAYPARLKSGKAEVPLKAKTDGDVRHLFWYIDQKYIGKFKVGELVFSSLKPGYHRVKIVDDKGRAASKLVNVFLVP